jgi:hypothetical protein
MAGIERSVIVAFSIWYGRRNFRFVSSWVVLSFYSNRFLMANEIKGRLNENNVVAGGVRDGENANASAGMRPMQDPAEPQKLGSRTSTSTTLHRLFVHSA